jgi:hypothetical protein
MRLHLLHREAGARTRTGAADRRQPHTTSASMTTTEPKEMPVFESTVELPVSTKSLTTAGHIMAATGVRPKIVKKYGVIVFEFPRSTEPALLAFLRAKRELDAMLAEEGK